MRVERLVPGMSKKTVCTSIYRVYANEKNCVNFCNAYHSNPESKTGYGGSSKSSHSGERSVIEQLDNERAFEPPSFGGNFSRK